MNAPNWVRCPACGERARAAKSKNEGRMENVQLRTGAFLYECSTPPGKCSLRVGVFSVFIDEEGAVSYEARRLDSCMDAFNAHARLVEEAIGEVRGSPLASRNPLGVLRAAMPRLVDAVDDLLREVP